MKIGKRELFKYLLYIMLAFTLTLAMITIFKNSSIINLPKVSIQKKSESWKNIPFESFTLVILNVTATPTDCLFELEECNVPPDSHTMTSTGSGIVVKHQRGLTHIMTAAHVCQASEFEGMVIGGNIYEYETVSAIEVVDYYGKVHPGLVMNIDERNDLCLVLVIGEHSTPVPIASEMPPIGSKAYNVAAPMGIFEPGMALIFDGYYSGEDWQRNVFYTIPAYPGSSGSAIFNENGEIIGIIHSATMGFPSIAIASDLDAIHDIMWGY